MGKVIVIEHVTLDGVMQAPARPDEDTRDGFPHGGWASRRGQDPSMQQVIGKHMSDRWSLLVGRTTYTDFYAVWPKRAPDPMAEALNRVHKYVASSTLAEPLPWQNSTLLQGDAMDAVAALKNDLAENLVVFGSGVLVRSLIASHLVDELVLQIHPLVLGSGRRLFSDSRCAELRLAESVSMANGVIIASYEPVQ